jgi:hypothetical protein
MAKLIIPRRCLGNCLLRRTIKYPLHNLPRIAQMPSAQLTAAILLASKNEKRRGLVEWVEEQEGRA